MSCKLCRYRVDSVDTPGNSTCLVVRQHPAFNNLTQEQKMHIELEAALKNQFPYQDKDGEPVIEFNHYEDEEVFLWPKDFSEDQIDTCRMSELKEGAASFETIG